MALSIKRRSLRWVPTSIRSEVRGFKVRRLHGISAGLFLFVLLDFCFEDQLLWRPGVLPGKEVEEFLLYVQKQCDQQGAAGTQTPGDAVRDNEQVQRRLVK